MTFPSEKVIICVCILAIVCVCVSVYVQRRVCVRVCVFKKAEKRQTNKRTSLTLTGINSNLVVHSLF